VPETPLNAIRVLATLDPKRVEACARDPRFLARYESVLAAFDGEVTGRTSCFAPRIPSPGGQPVAYFSAEFGVHPSLPVYSGGLGILSGDIAKEASDLGLPLVGVGFMYPQGYFHQRVAADGRQHETYRGIDRTIAPAEPARGATGAPCVIVLDLPGHSLQVAVSLVRVGRVALYLMDTDLEANPPWERELSARLYGGDQEIRLLQEILLGIGGVRVLRALGIRPSAWHANEGHAALMMLERAREFVQGGLPFEQAVERVRATTVFTTHTPVAAGHDAFPYSLVEKYLAAYWPGIGLDRERFLALGAFEEHWGSSFSMSALAFRLSGHQNAVSALHAGVSRRMWRSLWPGMTEDEAPIQAITNGVHLPSWIAPEFDRMYRGYVGADWLARQDDPALWQGVRAIPDETLWAAHLRLKIRLLRFLRDRARGSWTDAEGAPAQVTASGALLDPEVLTLGFARRFATYKRATLLFRDPARLRALLTHPKHPVQILFAGKAHPADEPGKLFLQAVYLAAEDRAYGGRIAFVEDYDIHAAQHMVQGVDVWLNTPRPPLEACGTSGQKAALNGVPNLSVLDGWWAEAYDGTNGWAIGEPEPGPAAASGGRNAAEDEARDVADAEALYGLLESQVVPLFYTRDAAGLPTGWIALMRRTIETIVPRFNTRRMLKDYVKHLYGPAWESVSGDAGAVAR
jgi:starch phosphorylase